MLHPAGAVKQRRVFTQVLNAAASNAPQCAVERSTRAEILSVSDWSLRRAFQRACERESLPALNIKDLRHSMVSRLLERGTKIHVVRDLMGDGALEHHDDEQRPRPGRSEARSGDSGRGRGAAGDVSPDVKRCHQTSETATDEETRRLATCGYHWGICGGSSRT